MYRALSDVPHSNTSMSNASILFKNGWECLPSDGVGAMANDQVSSLFWQPYRWLDQTLVLGHTSFFLAHGPMGSPWLLQLGSLGQEVQKHPHTWVHYSFTRSCTRVCLLRYTWRVSDGKRMTLISSWRWSVMCPGHSAILSLFILIWIRQSYYIVGISMQVDRGCV